MRANIFRLVSIYYESYSTNFIFEAAEHENTLDFKMIKRVPEVRNGAPQRGLGKDGIYIVVRDGFHETGVDVKVFDLIADHSIVFICFSRILQGKMLW